MKRTLTLVALSLIPAALMAQITLTQSSYSSWTPGTDTLKLVNGAVQMGTGANMTWDLSTANYGAGVYPTVYTSGINAMLPGSTFYLNIPFALAQGVTYNVKAWEGITSSGLLSIGESLDNQNIDLSLILDPGDNLHFPAQTIPYDNPRTIIAFPADYNDNWSSSFRSVTNFNATIASMFLNNAPAQRITNTTQTDTVIGWGKLRVKGQNGQPSAFENVLQVKTHMKQVDSFYLNGSPVPDLMLLDLGLSQGMESNLYVINYFRAGEVTPIVQSEYPDATYTNPTGTYVHMNRLGDGTGIEDIADNNGISIYPNPVKSGLVNINIAKNTVGSWSYQLTNVMGQTIAAASFTLDGTKAMISTEAATTPGIYYLQLYRNDERVSVKALSID